METMLDDVKSEKVTLKIQGKEREIKFGFGAWAKLEKEYGGVKNIDKLQTEIEEKPFEKIPHLLFIGLKDKSSFTDKDGTVYPEVTEENVLEEYRLGDVQMITEVFTRALYGSLPVGRATKKAVVEA